MNLPLYVYSNKNIVGCVLGIAALGAYVGGVIHEFWYAIAAGSYAIGALATPGNPALETQLSNEMSDRAMLEGLHALVTETQKRLPQDVFDLVQSIVVSIDTFMTQKAHAGGAIDEATYNVRKTATTYLPETLNAYAALPAAYRSLATVGDGQSPKALLLEQLQLLDGKMRELAANAVADDVQHLEINGRFLKEKFAAADAFRT